MEALKITDLEEVQGGCGGLQCMLDCTTNLVNFVLAPSITVTVVIAPGADPYVATNTSYTCRF